MDNSSLGTAIIQQVIASRDPNTKLASELLRAESKQSELSVIESKGTLIEQYTAKMKASEDQASKAIWANLIESIQKV